MAFAGMPWAKAGRAAASREKASAALRPRRRREGWVMRAPYIGSASTLRATLKPSFAAGTPT